MRGTCPEPNCATNATDAESSPQSPPPSAAKQKQREERIRNLPSEYHAPLSLDEERILSRPASEVIAACADDMYALWMDPVVRAVLDRRGMRPEEGPGL